MFQDLVTAAASPSKQQKKNERDLVNARSRASEAARITIPECVDPARRERCLADPPLFLKTYFPRIYWQPFGRLHYRMIDQIHDRAKYGGKKAVAAPRGRGKSEITKGMLCYLVLAELVRFALPICATATLGKRAYMDFRSKVANNELLLADFPEVCWPVKCLEGAPQRAGKQHVDGQLTQIVWTASDYLSLPHVPPNANEYLASLGDNQPRYGGVKMAYYGLDAAFRGMNIDGDRPDFILVDDPETRESARSLPQIENREEILDRDIAGLEGQGKPLSIVVLTTVQNRFCLSWKLTDPKLKPAYDGERFGWVVEWPKNLDLWDDYVAMRNADQAAGDRHGRNAVKFYLDHREAMDEGVELLADNYKGVKLKDGTDMVHSAIQEAFNKIADTSMAAFRTEYQNDPEPEEEIQRTNLTPARVQSRLSKLPQGEVPSDTGYRILAMDLGKYASHWVDIAFSEQGCIGSIVDYGIMETHGLTVESDNKAVEHALLSSLEIWADDVAAPRNPIITVIDSGTWKDAAYEFCRRNGKPFFPCKGWDQGRFHMPKRTDQQVPFLEAYARYQPEERIWLYHIQGEYWKQWLQDRFLVSPFDEAGNRNEGSMALFHHGGDIKRHLSFSHHMTAEEEQLVPVDGKELKRIWFVKNRNNHWLDAAAYACAAAGCVGVRLVPPTAPEQPIVKQKQPEPQASPFTRDGMPYLVSQR